MRDCRIFLRDGFGDVRNLSNSSPRVRQDACPEDPLPVILHNRRPIVIFGLFYMTGDGGGGLGGVDYKKGIWSLSILRSYEITGRGGFAQPTFGRRWRYERL